MLSEGTESKPSARQLSDILGEGSEMQSARQDIDALLEDDEKMDQLQEETTDEETDNQLTEEKLREVNEMTDNDDDDNIDQRSFQDPDEEEEPVELNETTEDNEQTQTQDDDGTKKRPESRFSTRSDQSDMDLFAKLQMNTEKLLKKVEEEERRELEERMRPITSSTYEEAVVMETARSMDSYGIAEDADPVVEETARQHQENISNSRGYLVRVLKELRHEEEALRLNNDDLQTKLSDYFRSQQVEAYYNECNL